MFERGIASGFFVVRRHSVNLTLAADEDKYFFRAGDARIEQVSVSEARRHADYRHYDRGKLVALALMNGHGVGKLELLQSFKRDNRLALVKHYLRHARAKVDISENADIAVENPRSVAVGACPLDIIVVARLHDLVARAEHCRADCSFGLRGIRRIKRSLHDAVDIVRSALTHSRRADDLDIVER